MRRPLAIALAAGLVGAAATARAQPQLVDPDLGVLERLTPPEEEPRLPLVDGLAFDALGNLFAALELPGAAGGLVAIDPQTGAVTPLVRGIARADQVALHPSGDLFVTSEVTPAATLARLFRVTPIYDALGLPTAAGVSLVPTSLAINNPEGIVVLETGGAYGAAGDLLVAEDRVGGRILRVSPGDGSSAVLVSGLLRPEGLAFGAFDASQQPALYAAVTLVNQVVRVGPDGALSGVGNPGAVGLFRPDNVEFGPDGYLYVSEDRPAPASRVIRIAADGSHQVVATGFGQAAGLAFDASGDLYVSEQDFARVWRLRFTRSVGLEVIARPLRPGRRGLVPVVLFGSDAVAAEEVDLGSLSFGPDGAPPARERAVLLDFDRDGHLDLLLHFPVAPSGIAAGDAWACLRGTALDGAPFAGCAGIVTVPRRGAP